MRDEVIPPARWEFNEEVTQAFQDMLARSIPDYETMRDACFQVGSKLVQHKTDIVDLGCSRGDAIASYVDKFGAYNYYIAADVSDPMLDACRKRFDGYITMNRMKVVKADLRHGCPPARASLILSILTLQFTPIEYRQRILKSVHDNLVPLGGFIMVEKVMGCGVEVDDLLTTCYLEHKRAVGYTEDQIQRKRLSLEGVLVPTTAPHNEQMLRDAGFRHVECFWRCLNFVGWVALK